MDLNSIDKIVLPWTWIMGFSNIAKHKYSWTLLKTVFSTHVALLHWHPKISSYLIQLHRLGSHDPQDPYFKRRIHGPHFLFINWDHNPTTLSTSTYRLGLSNESKLTAHIAALTLMVSGFFNMSPYLHKMTTKPKVRHLIFGLWPKLISLFREILGVVVWRAERYVQ